MAENNDDPHDTDIDNATRVRNRNKPKPTADRRPLAASADDDDERDRDGVSLDPHDLSPDPDRQPAPELRSIPRTQLDATPKVLVLNTTQGNRVGVANVERKGDDGKPMRDAGGMAVYAERVSVILSPGLNLVPVHQWTLVAGNLKARREAGEVQLLGDNPLAVDAERLVRAIAQTGNDAPIRWIMERDDRGRVQERCEIQLRTNAAEDRAGAVA